MLSSRMDEAQVDEFAISDNDPLPFKWVRYSRLKHPTGPFNESWLFDQVVQNKVRSVMVAARDKIVGFRLIDIESLLELVDRLAKQPGPPDPAVRARLSKAKRATKRRRSTQ